MPKQVIVQSSIEAVEIIDTPIPTPQDNEVVIRVVVAGSNPKDWKYPLWYAPFVQGLGRGVGDIRDTHGPTGRTWPTTAAMTWPASSIPWARVFTSSHQETVWQLFM